MHAYRCSRGATCSSDPYLESRLNPYLDKGSTFPFLQDFSFPILIFSSVYALVELYSTMASSKAPDIEDRKASIVSASGLASEDDAAVLGNHAPQRPPGPITDSSYQLSWATSKSCDAISP